METASDPRVFFAAERTLLAWLRSGLTVTGLGFVVSRFGLFLNVLAANTGSRTTDGHHHWISNSLGVSLVLLGSLMLFAALRNHQAYVRSLPPQDVPRLPVPWLASFLAVALAVIGLLLAVYLAVQ
jgi:putative membrane protein